MANDMPFDIFIIGGGINGCGIARDAAGRGLSVGLAEMNDIGGATSSASTKLFHGGLRYLEYFEFSLVRHALEERETLLRAMRHISWPMRFVLPYHKDMRFENTTPTSRLLNTVMPWMRGRRPAWLIRLGLFLYDHLGGRKILPATESMRLDGAPEGVGLNPKFKRAYEYSDCWIEDNRLVVLNARDAVAHGAKLFARTQVTSASRDADLWSVTLRDQNGHVKTIQTRVLVNAAGPWAGEVIQSAVRLNSSENVRLVRGSHIVTKRLFDHDKCYFFQGTDGRIIFAIPYETDFTLIGTTDEDHGGPNEKPVCTDTERDYLIAFINTFLADPIAADDVVWSYSGVRPLYDDGAASASAATRDYVLTVEANGPPVLNVFGGKITTYRCLAEDVLVKLADYIEMPSKWTAGKALPGGDFPVDGVAPLVDRLVEKYVFLDKKWALRLVRAYGTEAQSMLGDAGSAEDLGLQFGATLTEREVRWQMHNEFAVTAEDVVWRRTKLGLRMSKTEVDALDHWMLEEKTRAAA
ncbi:MAG: glycerol-3-phosphate dehydrogenase [Litoreibacter sp.]|nr:glycerol-3-phosphate dehydrogenase [Litoreibacter sp.]